MFNKLNKTNARMKKEMQKRDKREKKGKRLTLKSAREMVRGWTLEEKQENEQWTNMQIIKELQEYCDAVVDRDGLNPSQEALLRLLFRDKMFEVENWSLENKLMLFQVQMIGEKKVKGKIKKRGQEMLVMADSHFIDIVTPVMKTFNEEISKDNQKKIDIITAKIKKTEKELNNYRKIKERLKELRNRSVFDRDGFLGTGKNDKEIAELEKKLEALDNENEHHVNIKF